MRNFKKVIIDGEKYPIRCNIRVLGEIQEVYGKIKQFEYDIRGLVIVDDEEGKKVPKRINEPSMKAIVKVLPLMVNEGILLSNSEQSFVNEDEVVEGLETNPLLVARWMEEELLECFAQKKQ